MEMNKEKILSQIMDNVKIIGYTDITEVEILSRYNKVLAEHGEEKANNALLYTLKQFKEKAKAKDKIFWTKVKSELFEKNKSVPCSIRDIKKDILKGEINFIGIESEQRIKELLNIA